MRYNTVSVLFGQWYSCFPPCMHSYMECIQAYHLFFFLQYYYGALMIWHVYTQMCIHTNPLTRIHYLTLYIKDMALRIA